MPTPLILDKELSPDKEFNMRINLLLGSVNIFSRTLTFKSPNAVPLLSRVGKDFTFNVTQDSGDVVTRSKTWNIERFQKIKIGTSFCIKLRLEDDDAGYLDLNQKDKPKVVFNTSGSTFLATLNNEKGTFIEKTRNNQGDIFVTFSITQNKWNAINKPIDEGQAVSPANNKISLTSKVTIKKTAYQIKTNKERIGDRLIKIGNVHDILVFAYKQYDGPLNSKVKMNYLEIDGTLQKDEVKNSEPLAYSKAKDLFVKNNKQILNFTKRFDPKDGKKFIVYATVARYITNSTGGGTGSWLQINTNDEPIWARAVVEA